MPRPPLCMTSNLSRAYREIILLLLLRWGPNSRVLEFRPLSSRKEDCTGLRLDLHGRLTTERKRRGRVADAHSTPFQVLTPAKYQGFDSASTSKPALSNQTIKQKLFGCSGRTRAIAPIHCGSVKISEPADFLPGRSKSSFPLEEPLWWLLQFRSNTQVISPCDMI